MGQIAFPVFQSVSTQRRLTFPISTISAPFYAEFGTAESACRHCFRRNGLNRTAGFCTKANLQERTAGGYCRTNVPQIRPILFPIRTCSTSLGDCYNRCILLLAAINLAFVLGAPGLLQSVKTEITRFFGCCCRIADWHFDWHYNCLD